jgi:hypothetical protein
MGEVVHTGGAAARCQQVAATMQLNSNLPHCAPCMHCIECGKQSVTQPLTRDHYVAISPERLSLLCGEHCWWAQRPHLVWIRWHGERMQEWCRSTCGMCCTVSHSIMHPAFTIILELTVLILRTFLCQPFPDSYELVRIHQTGETNTRSLWSGLCVHESIALASKQELRY